MTRRQRFLATVNGETPDKLSWVPCLELWYRAHNTQGTLPPKYAGKTLQQIRDMLGCGNPGRDGMLYKTVLNNVEVMEEEGEKTLKKTYITPVGEVEELFRVDKEAKRKGYSTADGKAEYIVKDEKSFQVVKYIFENIQFIPTYEEYIAYQDSLGDGGECVPPCGHDPFYRLMEEFIGLSNVYLTLSDYEKEVEMLYHTLWEKQRELVEIMAGSPAKILIHGQHYDSMMTPPPIFKKYMLPYLKEVSEKLHKAGKFLAIHADADSGLLLEMYKEAGIDVLDCYCTAPMVHVTMEESLERLGNSMVIWGGIPSTVIIPSVVSYEDFCAYLDYYFKLLEKYKGKSRVVVAIADNVVPEADIGRVEKISERVDNFKY